MKLILAFSAMPLLLMLVYRYPKVVLWLFPVAGLFTVFYPWYPIEAGGFKLLPMDGVYALIGAYLGMHFLRRPKEVIGAFKENPFLVLFLAMVALSVVIYTPAYGQSAIGEARKFYGFFLFPLLGLVLLKRPEDFHGFMRVIVATAAVAALAALWLTATSGSFVRVVNAPATLIIALAGFTMIVLAMHRVVLFHPVADKILLLLFGALALGSAQRSVWLGVGAGSLILLWLHYGRPMLLAKLAAVGMAVLIAAATSLVYFPATGEKLVQKFAGIINPQEDPTASWRIEGWKQHAERLMEGNFLTGEGVGSYYRWDAGNYEVTTSPHNAYLQTALKFGLVGLAIYAFLAIRFFRATLAMRKRLPPGPMRAYLETGLLAFGAAHGYMLGYGFEPIMFSFFAVGTSAVKLSRESILRLYAAYGAREKKISVVATQPRRLGVRTSPPIYR